MGDRDKIAELLCVPSCKVPEATFVSRDVLNQTLVLMELFSLLVTMS